MRFIEADSGMPGISGLNGTVQDDRCTLRWQWPGDIQAVFIGRTSGDSQPSAIPDVEGLKLYTKAEYKANNGYHCRIEGVGRLVYTVYACLDDPGEPLLLLQPDGGNTVAVSAGRAKIRCGVRYKGGLFQRSKTILIQVTTEVPIAKDVLCYVKKQDGSPANKEDGILYPFAADFAPGKNVLPAIEVGKREYIRLFFTDGPKYGQMYELIQE